jgi:hypothetical protein
MGLGGFMSAGAAHQRAQHAAPLQLICLVPLPLRHEAMISAKRGRLQGLSRAMGRKGTDSLHQ